MTLKFGKHVGSDIKDVPEDYLLWLKNKAQQDVDAYQGELDRREMLEEASTSVSAKIIHQGFRLLAKKHHPDAGGNQAEFNALNAAYAQLKMLLEEIENVKNGTANSNSPF